MDADDCGHDEFIVGDGRLLYGPGFDLDTGVYLADDGPAPYRRGPLGDLASVAPSLREVTA